mgnify:CR=1 FL=1
MGQDAEQRFTDCEEVLRRAGLKLTHQRLEIYRELVSSTEHPDAETLYGSVRERLPTISLDTVYRTLRALEAKGVITRAGVVDDRGRFDANTTSHQHFVCTQCGRVMDVFDDELADITPPDEARRLGTVQEVHVEFRGICQRCASNR